IVPLLKQPGLSGGQYDVIGPGAVVVNWTLRDGARLRLTANLTAAPLRHLPSPAGRLLWHVGTDTDDAIGGWSVRWDINDGPQRSAEGTAA
ncbi:MAG: Malto-oligosyltrehalose trehalohydrolase, partial [Tardiphaga sp.]|uniref:DUF3459 domain-containing protein n=1 Tax=Tardiphaga sp. TaxID=1926292 RepID=UPI00260ADED2